MKVTAVILAGGESRRMGVDKKSLLIEGKSFLRAVYDEMSSFASEVIVSYSGVEQKSEELEAKEVYDEVEGFGPIAGLEASLKAARNKVIAVAPVDSPAVSAGVYRHMLSLLENSGASAIVPRREGYIEPLIAVYRRDELLKACRENIGGGNRRVGSVLEPLGEVIYVDMREFGHVDGHLLCFENVNTYRDYSRLKSKLG